jgi:hypothetical protein
VLPAIPIRPQFGPTLGRLLSPRWRAAKPLTRVLIRLAVVAFLVLALVLALTLLNSHFSAAGRAPFSFAYRGLYRTTPLPGEVVRVRRVDSHGVLKDSFAVSPLQLPPYAGSSTGELPVFATGYIDDLARRLQDFVLYGEGKTRVNAVPAYQVTYTASVGGRRMLGRDVLLVAPRPGQRAGVEISMLTAPTANRRVTGPSEVASTGVLLKPLKTFTLH